MLFACRCYNQELTFFHPDLPSSRQAHLRPLYIHLRLLIFGLLQKLIRRLAHIRDVRETLERHICSRDLRLAG